MMLAAGKLGDGAVLLREAAECLAYSEDPDPALQCLVLQASRCLAEVSDILGAVVHESPSPHDLVRAITKGPLQ